MAEITPPGHTLTSVTVKSATGSGPFESITSKAIEPVTPKVPASTHPFPSKSNQKASFPPAMVCVIPTSMVSCGVP